VARRSKKSPIAQTENGLYPGEETAQRRRRRPQRRRSQRRRRRRRSQRRRSQRRKERTAPLFRATERRKGRVGCDAIDQREEALLLLWLTEREDVLESPENVGELLRGEFH
jgi:hypothetical protein